MSGSFTLTGKLTFHDKVTPHVGATVRVSAPTWPDGADNVVYSQGVSVVTDADGSFTVPLLTETDLYYLVSSGDTPALFDPVSFLAPANGTVLDLSDIVSVNPAAITPTYVTQAQTYAANASASASAAAASAASVNREAINGVAGLDGSGKLFDIRLPDRLRNVAGREYNTVAETGVVSVRHPAYNADNTGATDCTAAVHAARDAAAVFGGGVFFPGGTYKTTSSCTMNVKQTWVLAPGATILGSGAHGVIVAASGCMIAGTGKIDAGAASAFCGVFINNNLTDVHVEKVEIVNGTYGVRCKGSSGPVTSRITLFDVHIHGQSSHGVFFNWETTNSEILSCQIHDVGGNFIWWGNSSTGNKAIGNTLENSGRIGIESFGSSTGSTILGNTIKTCSTIGISCDTSDGSRVAHNRVEATGSYGVELAGSNKCEVESNNIVLAGTLGVSISAISGSCDDNVIKGNTIDRPGTHGIYAGGAANGAKRLRLIGNEVIEPGNGAGSQHGISNPGGIGCEGWLVEGNIIRYTTNPSASQGIGVAGPNHHIVGNHFYYESTITTTGGTAISLSSTGSFTTVTGNKVYGNAKLNSGITVNSACTNCSITNNDIYNTLQNVIQNNSASTTNFINGNSGTISAGAGITMGGAMGANKLTSQGYVDHTGPTRFSGNIGFYGTTPIGRPTGWVAATGTATRATFATSTVTLATLAEHVKALEDDLLALGIIGP